MTATSEVLAHLGRGRLLAVLRGSSTHKVVEAGSVLGEQGIDILEVTFTVPNASDAITQLKARLPSATIGAGTVTTRDQLERAQSAGADFVVTPGATPALFHALAGAEVPSFPGVSTPSDVMLAQEAGAQAVKLFPGSMAGPAGLRALLGPFPDLQVIATGGVSPENADQWFEAGALAVGAGSDLAPPQAIDSANHQLLRARASRWLKATEANGWANTSSRVAPGTRIHRTHQEG